MLHRLRHETKNNLTSPFREIERKHKSNEISLFLHSIMQKNKTEKKIIRNVSVRFLTFVFKESFHDLSLFLKFQSFWRNNSSAWTSYCEIARTFTLGQVISFLFLQLRSRGWVSTSCLLFLRRRDWSVLTTYDPGSGDFCTITAGALRSVTQTFSPGFSTGRTEARSRQL